MTQNQTSTPSQTVIVPDLIGESRTAADSALARLGLQAQFSGTGTTVIHQDPAAGQSVLQSTTVELTVSNTGQTPPPQKVPVPNLIGETRAAVDSALARLGLQAQFSGTGTMVNDQSPVPGEEVLPGSTVLLTAGTDQVPPPPTFPPPFPMVTVPDVIGLTQAAAGNVLGRSDLEVRFSGTGSTVSHQNPAAGQQVQPRSTVVLAMSGSTIPK
jgi:beta-lactam-binding protein with PASTA domain